jgi:recombinational DNA repair protein (RecF pathway)
VPACRTLALVLRTVEVFETSLVATRFTRELRLVALLAKGARRLKSPIHPVDARGVIRYKGNGVVMGERLR